MHDLRTGTTAGWNSDARFPAASLVKLGVLAAALRRFGPYPERSAAWRDLRAMTATSDNRATNRLVDRLGGIAPVQQALLRASEPQALSARVRVSQLHLPEHL